MGSFTVRASPSTRWVCAVLRLSTTPAMVAASGVCTTTSPLGSECTVVTTGRFGSER